MGNLRVLDSLADPGLRFPAARIRRAAERQRYFPGRAGAVPGDDVPRWHPHHRAARQLCRGHGAGPVHAQPAGPNGRSTLTVMAASICSTAARRCHRLRGQLLQGPRLGERRSPCGTPRCSTLTPTELPTLLAPDILPSFTPAQMASLGVLPKGMQHNGLLALIELKNGDAPPSYIVGTQNFYTITRYNWSSYYATAVHDLGQEVGRSTRSGGVRAIALPSWCHPAPRPATPAPPTRRPERSARKVPACATARANLHFACIPQWDAPQ